MTIDLKRVAEPRLGEAVLLGTTLGGTRFALCPKPGFSSSAGYFGLRFGSAATRFRNSSSELIQVPDGSAHFLEHKLFEGREEKVFDRFGNIGAQFNGGTGFFATSYYFMTGGPFVEALDILLDFVQHPLITEERVEKEKGIIEQEVRMYEDDPGWRGAFLLHRALYHNHPIRIPPGGTVESVRETTADDLQACFDAFYRPSNLVLSLAGDFDPGEIAERIDAAVGHEEESGGQLVPIEEPSAPAATHLEERFGVARPHVRLAWRDATGVATPAELQRRRLLSSLSVTMALDASTDRHHKLYRSGTIDESFHCSYTADYSYGYACCEGQTEHPDRFLAGVRDAIASFLEEDPDQDAFERIRRAAWGSSVSSLQTPAALAGHGLQALLDGVDPFSTFALLDSISLEEVLQRARELFDPGQSASAVLLPADP